MKRFVFIAAMLSAVLVVAGTASAVLVTADLASVNPGTSVSVTYTGTPAYSNSPEAGNYLVNITGYGSNISGFCIDPAEASVGTLQNYNLVSIASQTLSSAQQTALTEAAWILASSFISTWLRYFSFGSSGKRITLPAKIRLESMMVGLCCLTRSISEGSRADFGLMRYTSLTRSERVSPGFTTLVI